MPPPTEDRLRVARELVERRDRLLAENELLETHATRLKPAGDDAAVDDNAAAVDDDAAAASAATARKGVGVGGKKGSGKGKKSGDRDVATEPPALELSAADKLRVATTEHERAEAAVTRAEENGEKRLGDLRARLEETELRVAETKRETFEFKRDVVLGAVNARTGKARSSHTDSHTTAFAW